MKILLVVTKAEIGGAQAFVLSLAKGLKKIGVLVSVAAGEGNFLPQELKTENIPFFYLKNLKRSKNPLAPFLFINELKNLINQEGFNVVHFNSTNTLPGVFAAKFSKHKPKTVFTVHGLSVFDQQYKCTLFLKLVFKIYFKFFLQYVQKIVFVSKYNLFEAAKQGITEKGCVIYNGLDISDDYFLSAEESKNKLEKLISRNVSEGYLIGSIGRLAKPKNYDFIINNWLAIKKIKPNAKLIIIGEGSERKKYETIIKKLNISEDVFLPGEIKEASRLLKGFNLFVLPSIYEGLSISLIEALFSSIPVLASNVGGNAEIIGEENCFKLDDKSDFLKKIGQNSTAKIDKSYFTSDNMVKKYNDIYEI